MTDRSGAPAGDHGLAATTPVAWLLLAPVVLWLLVFVVVPAGLMLVYSFSKRGTLGGVVFEFTTESYVAVLDWTYLRIVLRSLGFAAVTTLLCLIIGYPVGYVVGRSNRAARNRLLMLLMVPFWTSFLIRTYAWVTILKTNGLLNAVLLQLGWIAAPFEMLYTPGAVLVGLVYTFLPFMILPVYASVEKIDSRLIDSAFDLGAGPWRTFARVVVPLTRAGIVAGAMMVFVPALGLYAVNDILGGGRVDMIGNIIENQFKGSARNWPFGAALGMSLLLAFAGSYWLAGRQAAAQRG